jgi:hypothetical protein
MKERNAKLLEHLGFEHAGSGDWRLYMGTRDVWVFEEDAEDLDVWELVEDVRRQMNERLLDARAAALEAVPCWRRNRPRAKVEAKEPEGSAKVRGDSSSE